MSKSLQKITSLFFLLTTISCLPVKFTSQKPDKTQNPNPLSTVSCNPKLPGNATSITMTTSDVNPQIISNCTPPDGTYSWTVTRNGTAVTVPSLDGTNPTGNFTSLGEGTYLISLNVTRSGYTPYTTSNPLQISINNNTASAITCSPRLNNTLTSITLGNSDANPLVTSSCTPANVTYNWTIIKESSFVNVPGFSGSSSTPDFKSVGNGTYEVYLTATAAGLTTFTATTPLRVTVNIQQPPQSINCDPKINSTLTSITLNSSSSNPTIAANCTPSNVSYGWNVQKAGSNVTIPGLSGSSSVGDFKGAGAGTYTISMTATSTGFTSYTTSTPLTVIVQSQNLRNVTTNKTVTLSDNQLDILLVIDDSKSMLQDNQKLATRLKGLVDDLSASGFDWQMCATLTHAQKISSSDPNYYWGASTNWIGNTNSTNPWILKSGTTDTYNIFVNTINAIGAGWAGTDDERAIKAAWWHLWNGEPDVEGTSGCYRKNAGLAVIILSDEDERSVGGDSTQVYYPNELQTLENDDYPQTYINYVKQVFGTTKRFSVNSIIVRPNDTTCMASQDSVGSKSHYGVKYNELSSLTSGYVGSICDSDYSTNLVYFKQYIQNSLNSVPLECSPYNGVSGVTATVSPTMVFTGSLSGLNFIFNPSIPAGRNIQLNYQCTM